MKKKRSSGDQKELASVHLNPIIWVPVIQMEDGLFLLNATLREIRNDFDKFAWQERTGVDMLQIGTLPKTGAPRYLPWPRILQALNISKPEEMTDHHWKMLEKDLKEAEKNGHFASESTVVSKVPHAELEAFKKEATKTLHSLLKASDNEMKIDALAAVYAMKTEASLTPKNIMTIRDRIRALCAEDDSAFDISAGGMASVYRIKDINGKPTGMVVPAPQSAAKSDKEVKKYTKSIKTMGLTKEQFEMAKRNGCKTMADLQAWKASHPDHAVP